MRLITLNVRGASRTRKGMVPYQVEAMMAHAPDIVALSEVAIARFADYRAAFARCGLVHVLDSAAVVTPELVGSRSVGTMLASRFTCNTRADAPVPLRIPWPERLLSAVIESDTGPIEIDVVYIPYYYQGDPVLIEIKIETLNGLYDGLAHQSKHHRILCGDFNIPYAETAEGGIVSTGKTARQIRMYEAERRVLLDLAGYDLWDVFRGLHGYAVQQYSWHVPRTKNGFRLDHVLASSSLNPVVCQYLHHFRAVHETRPWGPSPQSLTDHSALEVVFDPNNQLQNRIGTENTENTEEHKEERE